MAKYLVIVESPAKAKTIKKFLGSSYKVEASNGHVRDLPKSQMGVDIESDFEPKYITIRGKGELLTKLRKDAKKVDKIYLATDPDREGEAISWHLITALRLEDKNVARITFNEITKTAVKNSIKQARDIDMSRVDAQQARRVLDRVVGYKISPLLWKKVKKGLSAGRVQSVALRLVCDREEEIRNFIEEEYWTIESEHSLKNKRQKFEAKFHSKNGKKIELASQSQVDEILKDIEGEGWKVSKVKQGERTKKSAPPFTTSTLQQEASKYLNFTTSKSMRIAQQLYEGVDVKGKGSIGLITYLRTDSTRISKEAHEEACTYIENEFGKEYVKSDDNQYKNKKNMQDAHEAIRPTYVDLEPDSIKESLSRDQYRLYKLIWNRFLASRMQSAKYNTYSVKLAVKDYQFNASGSSIAFHGFLKVYDHGEEQHKLGILNKLEEGMQVNLINIEGKQHFTQPPARFTEASLVKTLEEKGVGRPSTYAPTITTLLSRYYVTKESKAICTTELGEVVNDIMRNYFKDIVDVDFTAHLEDKLDEVEEGNIPWKEVLRDFYPSFDECINDAEEKLDKIEIQDEETDVICENCGRNMVIKFGRHGKFLACPGFPDCRNTKPYYEETDAHCPKCNGKILIKKTRKGRRYYGCENNPECEFMTWNKPTDQKCEKCGDILVEKGAKTLKCNNKECDVIIKNDGKDD
ncbi:type I DNA topoisomerase [Vallitalea okinawensis]|uniref:type I DNA topoisomerase n=1 Tax=Vallitalea okinawensis TaxID=2078660 RepID=UPI000CFD505A|nr:type I DNA topoisomerase [Vallitalea okinawensis]